MQYENVCISYNVLSNYRLLAYNVTRKWIILSLILEVILCYL